MSQLITKLQKMPIESFASYTQKSRVKFRIPQKAQSYDMIRVLKDSKASVDIITFYSKEKENGAKEILRKYIIKKGRWGKEVIEQTYTKLKDSFIQGGIIINGKKIKTQKTFDGEDFGSSVEVFAVTRRENDTPVVHISKIETSPIGKEGVRQETQSLFEYQNGMKSKGYKISGYYRTKNSFLNDIIAPMYEFKNISVERQNDMKNDPFLILHLYPMKNFKLLAPSVAVNKEHKPNLPFNVKWFSEENDLVGECADDILLNSHYLRCRTDIINAAAQENEHAYQKEQALFYAFHNNIEAPKVDLSAKKIEYYKKFWDSEYPKHIDSFEDAESYYQEISNSVDSNSKKLQTKDTHRNLVEKNALKTSYNVENNYNKSLANLRKDFPYAPYYLIEQYYLSGEE